MSVYLELENLNQLFRHLPHPPIIINDLSIATEDDKDDLKKMIYTRYDSDTMSTVPSCPCGATTGEYKLGMSCPVCPGVVTAPLEQDLQPTMWMRAPRGVLTFINPEVWMILTQVLKVSGFDVLQYLTDRSYHSKNRTPPVVAMIQAAGIERGYNNFIMNFDATIEFLLNLRAYRKHPKRDALIRMLKEYKDCIFCDHIPIPNKSLLVIEDTDTGSYAKQVFYPIVDAVQMIASIDYSEVTKDGELTRLRHFDTAAKERRTVKMMVNYTDFLFQYYKNELGTKPGVFRKHYFATRCHFSFRAVITSLTGPHRYDELHIPWGLAIGVFGVFLYNKLDRLGWSASAAQAFINGHADKYHPLLDKIFQELIAESKGGRGIPVTFCRNPSLSRGSFQKNYVTKVKTNPKIPTISMSILNVVPFNADFDGDAMGAMLLLDDVLSEDLDAHLPYMNAFDTNELETISGNVSIPKPVVAMIAEHVHRPDDRTDQSMMTSYLM